MTVLARPPDDLGLPVLPALRLQLAGLPATLTATALPLNTVDVSTPAHAPDGYEISLVPPAAPALTGDDALAFLTRVVLPLVSALVLRDPDVEALLDTELWAGGSTPREVLEAAGLIANTGIATWPDRVPEQVLADALGALADGATVTVGGAELTLHTAGRIGVSVEGVFDVPAGDYVVRVRLGPRFRRRRSRHG